MRGFYEESEEVKAKRELRKAAHRFSSAYLLEQFGDFEPAESELQAAALAYAKTQKPTRRPRKKAG